MTKEKILKEKILLILAVVLLIVVPYKGIPYLENRMPSGLTKEDVGEVYLKLLKHTGAPHMIPNVVVQENILINAWINPDTLTITTGMLQFLEGKDELAVILGHEMGHLMLQHFDVEGDSRLHESNADKYGIYLVLRAGYDICAAKKIWTKMKETNGDQIMTQSHPSPAQREWELDFPQCR